MAADGLELPTQMGDPLEKGGETKEENDSVEISLSPDPVAEEARKEELHQQALKIEEEIKTLKQALNRKEKQLNEIKRQLGITAWTQLRDGLGHQYHNLQGTQMYQKTADTLKDWNEKVVHSQAYNKLSSGAAATKTVLSDAGSKTANVAKNMGSATAKKLGEIRESAMFQSFENKVVSASSTLKYKMLRGSSKTAATSNPPPSPDNDLNFS